MTACLITLWGVVSFAIMLAGFWLVDSIVLKDANVQPWNDSQS